ncbi:MAG: chorismate synthase, partial [Candidatus Thorarchaeota archaeon]
MLRFFTAGESHGRGVVALIESFPAGYTVSIDAVNRQLARRQKGYGRGGRMKI